MTIESDLTRSMAEEAKAASNYRARARVAMKLGHVAVAHRYEHIAHEEDVHRAEFGDMRSKVRAGRA